MTDAECLMTAGIAITAIVSVAVVIWKIIDERFIRISLKDDWENPLYLCEKHAKKFIKKYGIGGCE